MCLFRAYFIVCTENYTDILHLGNIVGIQCDCTAQLSFMGEYMRIYISNLVVLQARGTQLDIMSSRSRHPSATSRRVNTRRWRGNPLPPAPAPYPGFLVHFL